MRACVRAWTGSVALRTQRVSHTCHTSHPAHQQTPTEFEVVDLSSNEMAKAHARYLAGGRAPHVKHEQLYRFEFPERPGALHAFLTDLSKGWNVSLFHYRNQGGDIGRVLVGMQVAPEEEREFAAWLTTLAKLGYSYYQETRNPVYHQFLF